MKLPKKIKIANHIFTVKKWKAAVADAHGQFGKCDCNTLVIKIDTSHKKSHIRETLLHEIMHAIFWVYGLTDEDKEERTITGLSVGLCQVLQDNPKLYSKIFSK